MRTVGLITEYNPFHNGHLHHLRESLKVADAEVSVAVMSGHFLQRGEPALVDKWVRTEMALRSGVDVVIELPFAWACNSAPYFACGAVQALNALDGVDSLCFGSEAGALAPLQNCADLLLERGGEVGERTAELLREGINFPTARARSMAELGGADTEALGSPNNILGIEYLKALRQSGSAIEPLTIRRIGAGYHDEQAADGIASATGIRRMVDEDRAVHSFMPDSAHLPFQQALRGGLALDGESLHRLLLARLFRGAESLRGLYQVDNGIENRLAEAACISGDYRGLVDAVKSRHFTRTRIQRILSYVFNEVRSEEMHSFLNSGPLYLHLLGSSEKGRAFLSTIRKRLSLPLIGNFSRVYPSLKRFYGGDSDLYRQAESMVDLELRSTRNYTLLMRSWTGANRNRDFFVDPLRF